MSPTVRAPGHPQVRVSTQSGSITIVGEPRDDVEVGHGRADLYEDDDGAICVKPHGSESLEVWCPDGADVVVGSASGSLHLRGRLGTVRATAESGGITTEEVEAADLRTVSGSIRVEDCEGQCRARTESGSIKIDEAGSVEASITSGTVRVGYVRATVRIRTVSGSVEVGAGGAGPVTIETMSGSVKLSLPRDCRPDLHIHSGREPEIDCEPGHDCEVRIRASSASVKVRADF